MSAIHFKAGGALTDEQTAIYIERKADLDALTHMHAMDCLLVIEPRQQGKTSLINRFICHPALSDIVLTYADMTTPDRSTEAAWYGTLCPRILRQLRSFIPRQRWPTIPQSGAGWREFLCDIAVGATDAHRRVVIALDEIGAGTFLGAIEFFSVLRDVYNSRQAEPELKQLTFLLAGAFNPRDLIKEDKISPFNIAQRVRLDDFSLAEVRELVGKGNWLDEQATMLAERIHYWTSGQPYLTQLLCSYLKLEATPADVDTGVERLRREDENHLPPMLSRLNGDERLRGYARRILEGEQIKFYPGENRRQAQLELLGLIKADTAGRCMVRNRIYELVLQHQATTLGDLPPITLSSPPPSEEAIRERRKRSRTVLASVVEVTTGVSPQSAVIVAGPSSVPGPAMPGPAKPAATLTWLHLSDLHFRKSQAYDENVVLKALLRDLVEQQVRPDFIAVSGDIAFSGQLAEYDLARRFFDDLLQTTDLGKDRLFLVPGNHDIDRGLISTGAQAIGDSLSNRKSANALLSTPTDRKLVFARFKGYAAFVKSYLGNERHFDDSRYFRVQPLDLAGQRLALLGLNSAWLCASDQDRAAGLLIGESQARAALEQAEGADLKIALLHHPFDWLREFDQNDSAAMLTDGCDFILHGHLHQTSATQLTSPDGAATILACGACYETREFANMYNWVRLDLAAGTGTVYLRRYSDSRGGFWAKDVMTYRNVPDGIYEFRTRVGTSVIKGRSAHREPARPSAQGHQQRCADLAESITETLKLIKQYEDQQRLTNDPKTKARAALEIADLRELMVQYETEYQALGCE